MSFFVFSFLEKHPCFQQFRRLKKHLIVQDGRAAFEAYQRLFALLLEHHHYSLTGFIAEQLLATESLFAQLSMEERLGNNLYNAALHDASILSDMLLQDWRGELEGLLENPNLPHLEDVYPLDFDDPFQDEVAYLAHLLIAKDANMVVAFLDHYYRKHGVGELAKARAFKYQDGHFVALEHPQSPQLAQLKYLDHQLQRLKDNTEAFLSQGGAQNCLLYGERGSGKSTAVRALLNEYGERGLRLIEVAPADLGDLSEMLGQLRNRPHHYILFIDDLSFEANDNRYQPLKSLLEGSLSARPNNVILYATSNRRNLIKEQFKDRPDPLDDDVHRWDTQNERLALSDRFGLTITFPSSNQKRYLDIVAKLLQDRDQLADHWQKEAIRFADWGNGYSGRTAQQFVEVFAS